MKLCKDCEWCGEVDVSVLFGDLTYCKRPLRGRVSRMTGEKEYHYEIMFCVNQRKWYFLSCMPWGRLFKPKESGAQS